MRLLPTCAALLSFIIPAYSEPASRQVWQPVQEYFIHIEPGREQKLVQGTRRLNSFVSYTHLGTDFGFHGPAEHTIEWNSDEVCAHLGQEPDAWAGVWHSLAGLAREPEKALNFAAAWPESMQARYQPRITGVMLAATGRGSIKLEIKSADQSPVWSQSVNLQSLTVEPKVFPISADSVTHAKLLTWTAEPGAEVCVSGLRLAVETPAIPFDEYVLAASYAKLARCYDSKAGMVKDRGHIDDGAFESIPATGLFALASAIVAREPLGIVSAEYARATVRRIHQAVKGMKRPRGLLPHFARRNGDVYEIHPGTEYSTVDTAIFYQSLLLSAHLLGDQELQQELVKEVSQIEFDRLRLPKGYLSHGLKDDGETLLTHGWNDWGGETALVMLLENMAQTQPVRRPMQRPGQAWQGSGFITEIQSLFYPDFDSDAADAVDGVKWLTTRKTMLAKQRDVIQRTWPGSLATKMGLYGLSAGEGEHGNQYYVGGADLPDQRLLHPHYVLMSGALAEKPAEVYALLERMEQAGFFPPWGMVENVTVTGSSYLPMNAALNAGFETLGAYHLLAKNRGSPDLVYAASRQIPEMRRAVELFYPKRILQVPTPIQAAE